MNRIITSGIVGCSLMAAMMACSKIDGNERMELVSTQVVPNEPEEEVELPDSLYDAPIKVVERRVLIEDHTGQKCPNCPDGAQIIRDLQRTYGARIVPVAIHSQMQGIMEPEGLGNELGNTYYKAWNLEFKPAGLINRISDGSSTVLDKTIWAMAVQFIMNNDTPDPLDIRIKAQQQKLDPTKADVDVKVIATVDGAAVDGKLQVWITEDNITARQDSMGIRLDNYVHNHVLRAAVNGTWGENISLRGTEGSNIQEFHYTTTLLQGWTAEDLDIVAFVTNENSGEVVQVNKAKLKITE